MLATWDAKATSRNLKFCIRVKSGPEIISVAGLIYMKHATKVKMSSFRDELWGPSGPEFMKCESFRIPQGKARMIGVNAIRIPDPADSEVECAVFANGIILPALHRRKIINQTASGVYDWIDLMTVVPPTSTNPYTTGVTGIQS